MEAVGREVINIFKSDQIRFQAYYCLVGTPGI